jgi:hypothetical protein
VRAKVSRVLQFEKLNSEKTEQILAEYGKADLGAKDIMPQVREYVEGKNYCVLVFLKDVEKIEPFHISKAGFGAMASWLTVDNINEIKL